MLEMQSQCRGQKNKVSIDTKGVIQALEQAELAGTFHSSLDPLIPSLILRCSEHYWVMLCLHKPETSKLG